MKKLLFVSMFAAASNAQAAPVVLGTALTNQLIVAETYSSQGALAVIHGNIQSGTYTSVGAGITGAPSNDKATVHGTIKSGTYTSTGDSAIVDGNITTGTYTSIGANSQIGGNIQSGTYTTTGASATVGGNVNAGGLLTLGASSTVGGSATGMLGGPAPTITSLQSDIMAQQAALKAMAGTNLTTGVLGTSGASFNSGVYNVADILSVTANTNITLTGDGTDQNWIFNIGNYMVLGAGVNIVLDNVGANSSVIWNVLGDSTGGAGLGYASLGAGVDFIGVVLANSYISVGATSALVSGVGNSCGGLYSATGYVSIGATSEVGGLGCTPSAVPLPAAAWLFGSALLGLIGVARRTKA
jgi:hypothetical protein